MPIFLERAQVVDFQDRDSAAIFENLKFQSCYFESCMISVTVQPHLRSTVRKGVFRGCEVRGCLIDAAVLEDILVDGLKTRGLLQTWGAVFRHVTLRGRLGRIMLSPAIASGVATPSEQRAFDEANARFYRDTDWALDITEGEFEELDLRGIPASLIRRDVETQVVVTRKKAMSGAWRNLDLSKTYWATSLQFLLDFGYPDTVLVAPKRHRKYRDLLDGLKMLRDAGVAELD